jgi:hypothetical protein
MKSYIGTPLITIFLFILQPIAGWSQEGAQDRPTLFSSDSVLSITIKTDMKGLLKMDKEDKYQKAKLYLDGQELKIRIRPRGNNRFETCSFPPITLNFKKTEFPDSTYTQLTKLKLVNTCKLQLSYEQFILREYMVYRVYNLLSDYSFKVRLLRIEYIDSEDKMKPIIRYGFVIEDADFLAKRFNGFVLKNKGLADKDTNLDQIVLLSLFEYMIGNFDWQVSAQQNLKLIKLMDINEPAPYVIPYDFDYSGLVDASYAIPSDKLGIESVRERLYLGKCYTEDELEKAIAIFLDKKDEIFALYNNFPLLNKASLNHSINYLGSFYKIIENEKSWKYQFIKNCNP